MTAAELSSMEKDMNMNPLLHPVFDKYPLLDTCISACKHCGKRLLNFGLEVHSREYHSGVISNELDDNIASMMKVEQDMV